jgi:hypothetical protein
MVSVDESNKPGNRLQRGTFSTATITKRSHSGRPSYQPPALQTLNAAFESNQRRDSISSSDHSSLSSNASNYESPYTSSLNINGNFFDIFDVSIFRINQYEEKKLDFYWDEDILRRAKNSNSKEKRNNRKLVKGVKSSGGGSVTSSSGGKQRCNCCLCMKDDLRRMLAQNNSLSSSPKFFPAIPANQESNSINNNTDIPSNNTNNEDKVNAL